MPNWASTNYRIEGEMKHLQTIYNVCKALEEGKHKPSANAADNWEGDIILALGLTEKELAEKKWYLRGFIEYFGIEDDTLEIQAEEAWGVTDFRFALKEIFGDEIEVFYITEEPGCEVYQTNDVDGKYFTGLFEVDSYGLDADCGIENFDEKEEALEYIANLLKRESITEEELDKWNEENEGEDRYILLHKYDKVAD